MFGMPPPETDAFGFGQAMLGVEPGQIVQAIAPVGPLDQVAPDEVSQDVLDLLGLQSPDRRGRRRAPRRA